MGYLWWGGEGAKYHSKEELDRTSGALSSGRVNHCLSIPYLTMQDKSIGSNRRPDLWGCVWQEELPGLLGQVIENPIASYEALAGYKAPVYLFDNRADDVERIKRAIANKPNLVHGIGWMQLYERLRYLRPAQELYLDIADDLPELYRLRDVVAEFLHKELDIYLSLGVDIITFSEDWGTQTSLQISPESWRRIFKPAYKELFDRIHKAGCMVEFHSCGYIMNIIDDLIDLGVEIVNPQVGCMPLKELAARFKGRICFHADFDRQKMPLQTPEWVRNEVFRIVEHLGSPEGGLFISAEVPGVTSLENVEAYIAAIKELSVNTGSYALTETF